MNSKLYPTLAVLSLTLLAGCETVVDQYGNQRQVMSPTGAAALETLVATGIGAGSGALLQNQPGWLNGMVSSLSGSVASQLVNSVSSQGSYQGYRGYQGYQGYSQPLPSPQYIQRGGYQTHGNYYGDYPNNQNNYSQPNQRVLYTRLPNGQFVPVNP